MKISHKSLSLAFVTPFEISKLRRSSQDVLRVKMEKDGFVGFGETPAISYYGKDVSRMAEKLEASIAVLEKIKWEHPYEWYAQILKIFPEDSFLRSALDGAAWDIYGQGQNKMVWEILDLPNPATANISNFTIGIGTPKYVVDQMQQYPWLAYKLKLGGSNDRAVLKAVALANSAPLRIDANGAWSKEEALGFLDFCQKELPTGMIELIEEPYQELTPGLSDIRSTSTIPFYADESFQSIADLENIRKYFHGINVKLDKCGGLTPSLEIIDKAKAMDLKIQLGCMSASGIALAPAIQMSALADVVDLDSAMMIVDASFGVQYQEGVVTMAGKNGLGIVAGSL